MYSLLSIMCNNVAYFTSMANQSDKWSALNYVVPKMSLESIQESELEVYMQTPPGIGSHYSSNEALKKANVINTQDDQGIFEELIKILFLYCIGCERSIAIEYTIDDDHKKDRFGIKSDDKCSIAFTLCRYCQKPFDTSEKLIGLDNSLSIMRISSNILRSSYIFDTAMKYSCGTVFYSIKDKAKYISIHNIPRLVCRHCTMYSVDQDEMVLSPYMKGGFL